jgi:hypothetical protein
MNEVPIEKVREILKSQYHAALTMLRETIEQCPDDVWLNAEHKNAFWQIAYHALFFTHVYLQPSEAAFRYWEHSQKDVQNPDAFGIESDPNSNLPLLPKPYTKTEVLAYWNFCDQMVDRAVDALDLLSADSGFRWYKESKLEHQFINLRHIEHHTAQLADRLRSSNGIAIRWIGSKREI